MLWILLLSSLHNSVQLTTSVSMESGDFHYFHSWSFVFEGDIVNLIKILTFSIFAKLARSLNYML